MIRVFKFHCDSINMIVMYSCFTFPVSFKFHCDSINMMAHTHLLFLQVNLNSTVILLICRTANMQTDTNLFKFHCDSINIEITKDIIKSAIIFKFHCDSINMELKSLILSVFPLFKFHCDSINI